jgi:hypothetical protein
MKRRGEMFKTSAEANDGVGEMDGVNVKGIKKDRDGMKRYAKGCQDGRY